MEIGVIIGLVVWMIIAAVFYCLFCDRKDKN